MGKNEILRVLEEIAEFEEEIVLEMDLKNDLEFDSLMYIDLAVKIKKITGREISAFELSNFNKVGDIVEFVGSLQK
ncbi:phosphopantetheine-binding protein [Paenibacillus tundrae]|uniref:phosphopantetheine-binding protein n=1 Tax=Paenibacillus tundrae TaxID=528187 RepID=UPI0022A9B327|nr:phosphopantetheine-binding protein [Paenibacillus tundrae]